MHEDGGWPEADLLQAADSLSFLETMAPVIVEWVQSGRAPRERAEGKLRQMAGRISADLPRARELGRGAARPRRCRACAPPTRPARCSRWRA